MRTILWFFALIAGALEPGAPVLANDGVPDPSFGTNGLAFLSLDGVEGHELKPRVAVALPDGRLLFGGMRNLRAQGDADPHMLGALARMTADGSADVGFGSDPANPGIVVLPDIVPGTAMQIVESMRVLQDGRIVAAGSGSAFGPPQGFVVRLNSDGTVDTDFGDGGIVLVPSASLHAVALDSQSRIVVAGEKIGGTPQYRGLVVRLNADGQLDTTFGDTGLVTIAQPGIDQLGYLSALAITADDRIVVGGSYQVPHPEFIDNYDFSIVRITVDGDLDPTFAGGGWRVFSIDSVYSDFDGIDRLLLTPDGGIIFAGHYNDVTGLGTNVVLGRFDVDGLTDMTFGTTPTPGYSVFGLLPEAYDRYASDLMRQNDGKLIFSVNYAGPNKQLFLAVRTNEKGELDRSFGDHGTFSADLAPNGLYSEATALSSQAGRIVLVGAVKRGGADSLMVDLAAVRLDIDAIFSSDFDAAGSGASSSISTYEDIPEGSAEARFHYNGVLYHDVNGTGGVFPDGSTFTADDVGSSFMVENSTNLFDMFPMFGSRRNTLTFGGFFIPGDNLTIGALVRATMDLDQIANAASLELAFYENGPWGGIQLHLDAYRSGSLVGSTTMPIRDLGGHDNPATSSLSISGVYFDSLHLYATFNGQPSAPRVLIDNLTLDRP